MKTVVLLPDVSIDQDEVRAKYKVVIDRYKITPNDQKKIISCMLGGTKKELFQFELIADQYKVNDYDRNEICGSIGSIMLAKGYAVAIHNPEGLLQGGQNES